jgi:hypothetical protein
MATGSNVLRALVDCLLWEFFYITKVAQIFGQLFSAEKLYIIFDIK